MNGNEFIDTRQGYIGNTKAIYPYRANPELQGKLGTTGDPDRDRPEGGLRPPHPPRWGIPSTRFARSAAHLVFGSQLCRAPARQTTNDFDRPGTGQTRNYRALGDRFGTSIGFDAVPCGVEGHLDIEVDIVIEACGWGGSIACDEIDVDIWFLDRVGGTIDRVEVGIGIEQDLVHPFDLTDLVEDVHAGGLALTAGDMVEAPLEDVVPCGRMILSVVLGVIVGQADGLDVIAVDNVARGDVDASADTDFDGGDSVAAIAYCFRFGVPTNVLIDGGEGEEVRVTETVETVCGHAHARGEGDCGVGVAPLHFIRRSGAGGSSQLLDVSVLLLHAVRKARAHLERL